MDHKRPEIEIAKEKTLKKMKNNKRIVWRNHEDFVFIIEDVSIVNTDVSESDQGFVWYEDKQANS